MFGKKHSSFICSSNHPHPPNKAVPLYVLECCAVLCLVSQSCPTLCDPMDYSSQGPLSMGFSMQEYWSGLSCPPPGDLANPGIEPRSPALQADSLPVEISGKPMC